MLAWPELLCPTAGGFAPFVRSLSGGQSISGFEQVQPQLHDRWSAAFEFQLRSKPQLLELRTLLLRMRGRAGTVGLPAFDRGRGASFGTVVVDPTFSLRWPRFVGTRYEFSSLPGITGTATIIAPDQFSFVATGDPPIAEAYVTLLGVPRHITRVAGMQCWFSPSIAVGAAGASVTAAAAAAAPLNATSIDLILSAGSLPPTSGMLFSIGNRMHAIETVLSLGVNTYRLGIWPWLRAAVGLGAVVNVAAPLCEMRFASDREGADAMAALQLLKFCDVTLRFDEATAS